MKQDMLTSGAEPGPDPQRLMTAEELARLPDDGSRYELVQGRVVQMPPPGFKHGEIVFNICVVLWFFLKTNKLEHLGKFVTGEPGFALSEPEDPDTVRAPDVAFVLTNRLPPPGSPERQGYPRLAPDLAVEVASPSQYRPEMADTARMWLAAGVRLVWIVWPESRQIDVWLPGQDTPVETLAATATLSGRDVLPGFTCTVADLFH